MSLFKRRKVEEINLEIIENINNEKVIDNTNMYSEKQMIEEDSFDETLDFDSKKQLTHQAYQEVQKKNQALLNLYFICKIFSRLATKDKEYNQKILTIDKHINRIRKDFELLVKIMKTNTQINNEQINNLYIKANDLLLSHKEIHNNLEDIRKKYFNHLKIATVNVCMNKTNQELETMYKDLTKFLEDFKNLNEAAEFIFYNSGQVIVTVINSLVECIKNAHNGYDYNYFLQSDVVITLDIKEWIDLYNKIKFVVKMTNKEMLTPLYLVDFKNFELRYLILMMNLEASKDKKVTSSNI